MRTSLEDVAKAIGEHAARAPYELCGALLGMAGRVTGFVPLENRSHTPETRFFITAADVLRIEKEAEAHGAQLVGFYHSHPRGTAEPSPVDIEAALPGYIYLIASGAGDVRAWLLREDRSCFDEVEIGKD